MLSVLHPLVQQNTSTLSEQRFSSTFTGNEFFLKDHMINGQKVLPGVAYLEMAREAVKRALGDLKANIQLKNVVWIRPIIIETEPKTVHIGLFPEENGNIAYEIYTEDGDAEVIIHSQGLAIVRTERDAVSSPNLDINALKSTHHHKELRSIECYEAFDRIGIKYGPTHRGVERIYVGENSVLAKLTLPASARQGEFELHPSIMDSALQASLAMVLGRETLEKAMLPFALHSLEVFSACTSSMWAIIHRSEEKSAAVEKLDIELCDEEGKVCVVMNGFSSRLLERAVTNRDMNVLMLTPAWKGKAIEKHASLGTDMKVHIIRFDDSAKTFEETALELFEEVQAVIQSKPKSKHLFQVVINNPSQFGLSGILKTAHIENQKLYGQLILVSELTQSVEEILEENRKNFQDKEVWYKGDTRTVKTLEYIDLSTLATHSIYKENGIYLITGGAGGLGFILAKDIVEKMKSVTVILTGRSELSSAKEDDLRLLQTLGESTQSKIEYLQADITNKPSLESLIEIIQSKYGFLSGIIHAAGIVKDNFILKKSREEFASVLLPKVRGTIYLDELTKEIDLDFFLLFSSVAGAIGNLGQADYATGNAFMDAFARQRNEQVAAQKRHGRTLSINWPLWKEGGMHVDKASEQRMKTIGGMVPMETSTGLKGLAQGFACGADQVMLLEGNIDQLKSYLIETQSPESMDQVEETSSSIDKKTLFGKVSHYLKQQLSTFLKVPIQKIENTEALEKYGIDSIMVIQLTNELEKAFGSLSKTLFFEYQTIDELSQYFMESHSSKLVKLLRLEEAAKNYAQQAISKTPVQPNSHHRPRFSLRLEAPLKRNEVAIIGISGRYPQSLDLKAYWENLRDGKDCITEIPSNRWDWRKYYDQHASEAGAHYSKWGGFIEGVDEFDPLFFNISPKEAIYLDPQERLFLEHAWMALEDAGITRTHLQRASLDDMPGQVGVYAGVMWSEYQLFGAEASLSGTAVSLWGSFASIANRVSYVLNLHGPSMTVDTMCSSSLTSIHLACEDLKSGRTDLGIAGGVNVSIHPNKYLTLSTGQFISKEGHCQSFGEGGDGYIPGEGVGVVILKRLSHAIADQDYIYGVIKGTAINHGGKTNGYTVPNPNAQQMVIARALKESKIDPRTISYIEAHGTGTKLGDPIEITGLTKAFQASTNDTGYCAVGSAKSNIGHCESAAGIAGMTKVLLQMEHKKIVPSLHSEILNPNIDFEKTPFIVNQKLIEWNRPVIDGKEYPRIAGISSFGAGGSNAHIIIEEHISKEGVDLPEINEFNPALVVLSAKNNDRLKKYAEKLLAFIKYRLEDCKEQEKRPLYLGEIAYTLQVGREAMEERLGIVVGSIEELMEKLTAYIAGEQSIERLYLGQVKKNREMISDLETETGFQNAIEGWIEQKHYEKLLKFWVKGLSIDWTKLYREHKPKKTPLPTYPFAKERYWIDTASTTKKIQSEQKAESELDLLVETTSNAPKKFEAIQTLYFETTLEKKPLLVRSETAQQAKPTVKTMVCFLSNPEQKLKFLKKLEDSLSTRIIFISQGSSYKENSPSEYQIISTDKETYYKALTSIRKEYGTLDNLVYLWAEKGSEWIQNAFPIVTIIQIIAELSLKIDRLLLAGSFDNGIDNCWLESWIGVAHSVGFILPHTKARVILHHHFPDEAWDWGNVITKELEAENLSDVVYRQGERYEYSTQPISFSLDKEAFASNRSTKKRTILITGGSGAIGFAFAKHFASTETVNLILNGRSILSPKIEHQIKELENLGSSAMYMQADSCDLEAMRSGIEQAKVQFGSINEVIHAAGIESKKNVLTKSFSEFERILGPKIQGTQILDEVLKEEPLDFICYFSSSSAILGDFGTCDYAMGNRFEMAYAGYRNELREKGERKGRAIVINWPLWKEGGMSVEDAKTTDFYIKTSGQDYLETKQALSLFDQLLIQNKNQLLVIVGYPSRVNQFLGLTKKASTAIRSRAMKALRGRRIEMRGLSLGQCVILDLKEIAGQILKIPTNRLDSDINLADFGFDSISLAEFARGIGKHYELEVIPSVFFGYSTLSALTDYLLKEHLMTIQKFYQEECREEEHGIESVSKETGKTFNRPITTESTQVVYQKKESIATPDESDLNEPLAIIGMSGRFPDARNIEEMWEILRDGKEAVHEIPIERFDWRKYYGNTSKDREKTNCKWSGLIPGAAEFDPLFFEISPKEAEIIDPRQRHLLQESWKALEDAGYGVSDLKRQKIGMLVGVEDGDYSLLVKKNNTVTSSHNGILAARLAYFLNLSGAVMSINTACSSSLVALHQACLALKTREIDTAIVAGVNMLFTPEIYVAMSQAGMLSSDGKCYAFDERANGMVPGEAIAVVVLKRLSEAERDGDPIKAIIRGSGLNYDGKTNGITAPSGVAQKELLLSVYEKNHIHPENIEYFVAHGTGTSLGDPVEINAVSEVLKTTTEKRGYCALTSPKTNFGHTFAASGLVSVISLIKALQEETIPASLHCENESRYIDWKESPLYVNKAKKAWPISREEGSEIIAWVL